MLDFFLACFMKAVLPHVPSDVTSQILYTHPQCIFPPLHVPHKQSLVIPWEIVFQLTLSGLTDVPAPWGFGGL